jgi:SAM-dependent methyltransferase
MPDSRNTRSTFAPGQKQPPQAYERLADIYDELGFDRFTAKSLERCRDYLADSGRTVARMIDLACGTGHFAIAMAHRGVEVTGIDRARGMLRAARRNAGRMKHPPAWRQGAFVDFRGPEGNDLITCWFDALNHLLTDLDTVTCFRRVYRHLAPGGAFLFDVNTPRAFHEQWNQTVYRSRSNYVYVETGIGEPDGEYARLNAEAFVRRGRRYERLRMAFYQRAFTPGRTRRLLRQAGFVNIAVGSFDSHLPLNRAVRLLVSAERPRRAGLSPRLAQ